MRDLAVNLRNINQIRYSMIRIEDSLLIVKNKNLQDYILQPVIKKFNSGRKLTAPILHYKGYKY